MGREDVSRKANTSNEEKYVKDELHVYCSRIFLATYLNVKQTIYT